MNVYRVLYILGNASSVCCNYFFYYLFFRLRFVDYKRNNKKNTVRRNVAYVTIALQRFNQKFNDFKDPKVFNSFQDVYSFGFPNAIFF